MSRARLAGATSQREGAATERAVEAMLDRYRMQGVAFISKNSPPFTVTARGKGGRGGVSGFFTGRGGPDYSGALAPRGQAIAFEVKRSSSKRLPLYRRSDKPTLPRHQRDGLEQFARMGGVSGVLVSTKTAEGVKWWWLTVDAWDAAVDHAKRSGRASLLASALEEYSLAVPTLQGSPDFLGVAQMSCRIKTEGEVQQFGAGTRPDGMTVQVIYPDKGDAESAFQAAGCELKETRE